MPKTFEWAIDVGATQTRTMRTNSVRFGDGYEQVTSTGINNISKSWQCSRTEQKPVIDAIQAFLDEHAGVLPFYMTFNGKTDLYRTDGEIEQTHIGNDVWRISFTVKQHHAP